MSIIEKIDNIFIKLNNYLHSFDFLNGFRESKKNFTRENKLSFVKLITFILNLRNKSTQAELNDYFDQAIDEKEKTPKKCTFFKARLKIKVKAILNLLEKLCEFFYQKNNLVKKWNNFRLIAGDMSTFTIPLTGVKRLDEELISYFGKAQNQFPDMKVIQAKGHILYDILNELVINGILTSYSTNERLLFSQQLDKLDKGDLLLLDRGYPAVWIFSLLYSKNLQFVTRLSKSFLPETDCFFLSKEEDKIIEVEVKPEITSRYPNLKISKGKIKIRLVKVFLDSGEVEVLATSLLDKNLYPRSIFKDLYFKRWPVESVFDSLKNKLQLEWFSGKKVKVILQDFYAKLFQKNLYSLLKLRVSNELKESTIDLKYKYAINENIGYNILKNRWVKLFLKAISNIIEILNKLAKEILEYIEPIRPNRKYERNKKRKSKSTMIAYANRIAI